MLRMERKEKEVKRTWRTTEGRKTEKENEEDSRR